MPVLTDTLAVDSVPVNLTDCTVALKYQNLATGTTATRTATVVSASAGTVSYAWEAADTTELGTYQASWVVTKSGKVQTVPTTPFEFRVMPAPTESITIASFRPYIRTLLGDTDANVKEYSSEQLDDAVRLAVNLGKVPGVSLTTDGLRLTPAVVPDPTNADATRTWSQVVFHAAKYFILPNAGAYAYRTRALSEVFGSQADFVQEILTEIYNLDNPGGCL